MKIVEVSKSDRQCHTTPAVGGRCVFHPVFSPEDKTVFYFPVFHPVKQIRLR